MASSADDRLREESNHHNDEDGMFGFLNDLQGSMTKEKRKMTKKTLGLKA